MATAKINLNALTNNVNCIRSRLSAKVELLAAVKANAYGHGAIDVAKHLNALGVNWFGVATPLEALELYHTGISGKILVLNPVYQDIEALIARGICLTIVDDFSLMQVEKAAKTLKQKAIIHLKVDTGMGRLGLKPKEALGTAIKADESHWLVLEGIWTHLACADEEDRQYTYKQLEAFEEMLGLLEKNQIAVPLKHAANSAGIFAFSESHFNMVRAGISLYGYHSSPYMYNLETDLRPVMTVMAGITFIKRLKARQSVSYGATWTADKDTTIATVRYGYADGYPRILSNVASVWCKDKLRPIRGRVCMDQLMIDMGDDEVNQNDLVILFGDSGVSALDLAELCNTIAYEILTSVGSRVERVYVG